MTRTAAAVITATILPACSPEADSGGGLPETVVETRGDTTIVRTLAGSVREAEATLVKEVSIGEAVGPEELLFGRISSFAVDDDRNVYVLDDQAQQVRVFDQTGAYVETLGRPGEGPGEFGLADAVAVLPDGRVAVRDPLRMLVHVFIPETGDTDQWTFGAGGVFLAAQPLYTDRSARTLLYTHNPRSQEPGQSEFHMIVFGAEGTQLDTVPEPSTGYERPRLRAVREIEGGGTASVGESVPFMPDFHWTIHPNGHRLTGFSADYRIDLERADGILRIERAIEPVSVSAAERDAERQRIIGRLRGLVPDWDWDGPPIPEQKPFFKELYAGRDGRIWVQLSTDGREVENLDYDPDNPRSQRVTWHEATRFDVFEEDGTYRGTVVAPDEFSGSVQPVFGRDHVWCVTVDELGVQRVVRYGIPLS